MPKNYSFGTLDPSNPEGPKKEVIIPYELGLRYYKYDIVRYFNFYAVKEVLDNPKRIFSRIRVITDGGWCYVGRPTRWYVKEKLVEPFPKHLVYAVYVNDRMFLHGHRAELADQEDVLSPKDWKTRFGGLAWKSTS